MSRCKCRRPSYVYKRGFGRICENCAGTYRPRAAKRPGRIANGKRPIAKRGEDMGGEPRCVGPLRSTKDLMDEGIILRRGVRGA